MIVKLDVWERRTNGRSKCNHSADPSFWTLNKPIANSKTCLCGQILSMSEAEKGINKMQKDGGIPLIMQLDGL